MYNEGLICVVKVDGKILRENSEEVYIPFGSEFSLYFKNEKSRGASVKVSIDGTDVLDGEELCVRPNSTLELERFIKNGDMKQGRRFRFIEKTSQIVEHRGDKIDDGFIRVEYQFEKEKPIIKDTFHNHHHQCPSIRCYICNPPIRHHGDFYCGTPQVYGTSSTSQVRGGDMLGSAEAYTADCSIDTSSSVLDSLDMSMDGLEITPQSDEGITVAGSKSEQTFQSVTMDKLEDISHTMIIRLKGQNKTNKKKVKKVVTTKAKIECPTCGKKWSSAYEYCAMCSTALKD